MSLSVCVSRTRTHGRHVINLAAAPSQNKKKTGYVHWGIFGFAFTPRLVAALHPGTQSAGDKEMPDSVRTCSKKKTWTTLTNHVLAFYPSFCVSHIFPDPGKNKRGRKKRATWTSLRGHIPHFYQVPGSSLTKYGEKARNSTKPRATKSLGRSKIEPQSPIPHTDKSLKFIPPLLFALKHGDSAPGRAQCQRGPRGERERALAEGF